MREGKAKGSELIIYPDGTIYHIDLKADDMVPKEVFLVGAPERVDTVADHFDRVLFKHKNSARPEFSIAVGEFGGRKVAVMHAAAETIAAVLSTGIGMDNTEISLTELHALWEYKHREKDWGSPVRAKIIRIGTSGTSRPDIPVGTCAISAFGLGLDNLGVYYPAREPNAEAENIALHFAMTDFGKLNPALYCAKASTKVLLALESSARELGDQQTVWGITTSSPGFFAPQGRTIGRIKVSPGVEKFVENCANFEINGLRIVNHEMETALLCRLGENLGYDVGAICLVVANRSNDEFLEKEKFDQRMKACIDIALEAMRKLATSA